MRAIGSGKTERGLLSLAHALFAHFRTSGVNYSSGYLGGQSFFGCGLPCSLTLWLEERETWTADFWRICSIRTDGKNSGSPAFLETTPV